MVSPINIPILLINDVSYSRKRYVHFVTRSMTVLAHPIYMTTDAQLCVGVQLLVRLIHTLWLFRYVMQPRCECSIQLPWNGGDDELRMAFTHQVASLVTRVDPTDGFTLNEFSSDWGANK